MQLGTARMAQGGLTFPGRDLSRSPAIDAYWSGPRLGQWLRLSSLLHPGRSLRSYKRRGVFLWRCLRHGLTLREWQRAAGNPLLGAEIAARPSLLAVVERPYLHARWTVAQRLAAIDAHYRAVAAGRDLLDFPPSERVVLPGCAALPAGMRLVLEKPVWLMWEGEVALSLFENESRLYSLVFSLGSAADGTTAYIGGIKGSAGGLLETYRRLTRNLHGMRPRDLLFRCFRLLCRQLGVLRLWGISDRDRLHRNGMFAGRVTVFADYDVIWAEYGGVALDNGFFEIPLAVSCRAHDQIPARKRAQYRRRYEMLDRLACDFASLGAHSAGQRAGTSFAKAGNGCMSEEQQ